MAPTETLSAPEVEQSRSRVNVLGVGIDAIDMRVAVDRISSAIRRGTGGYVCVSGVHGVMEAQRDSAFRRILNRSLLTTPDGMPTVWVGRAAGFRSIERVYGPDLMLAVCEHSLNEGLSHFLFGGAEGVAERLRERLVARFDGLEVVGTYTPPFRPLTLDEEDAIVARLAALRPDLIWIGLSTPKQEKLMARLHARVAPAVMLGVGAAFDFHGGRVTQAPRWIQRSGFEWFFRMLQEPRRLLPRYARNNLAFIYRILLQGLGIRRHLLEE